MRYAELHAHSAYSFLDGSSLPEELAMAAAQRGYGAFALTDHNSLSGSMEFAQTAKAVGVKAIHGAEVDVIDDGPRHDADAPRRHVTLLVREERGWRNLCRLLTRAHAHTRGIPSPGTPSTEPQAARRDLRAACVTLADVEEHAEGLVCLSGCAARGVHDERTLGRLLAAFGRDSLRVELQRPFLRHDRALNRELAGRASRLGLETAATGDVHAHTPARAQLQDALVAIREHTTLDASEPLRRGNHSHVLATPFAMASRFPEHPEAVAGAAALADELSFDLLEDLGYRYPHADDPGADRTLAELTAAAFDVRYPHGHPLREEALPRLEEELAVIRHLGLSGFFILHRDLLELAREVALEVRGPSVARSMLPPGRGRGSSVSSIVCYLTGLSHVDPIANRLLLGRFLNEDIVALPDIDLDFPRDIREVLIPRVHDRYGRQNSALVAAFPTYRARGAVREIGKALGLPPGEIERVARSSEAWSAANVDKDIAVALGKGRERRGRWAWLAKLSEEAHGLPRHLSQHSGGMIVSTRPLVDCVPLVPAAMEGRQLAQWDKDSCSDAGFLKIDLLGLGMLSAVERCVDHIAARRGEHIDLSRIPYDDKATYASIQAADTTGVFQIESRAQMASLHRTRPETLDDITIQVAIVRPGPIVGGAVNPYITRRQALRANPDFEVPYEHPSLEEPLRETLGTIIFQDQVIEVARAFAGFTHSEAEGLRRAMSRKRSEAAIRAYTERFVEGSMATHPDVDEAMAHRVYEMIVGFSGFGFPKGHGAAFGLLAYQSAWLRVHYGPEFVCALLDEQPMGFYPSDALVHEAQRRGIDVLGVDVNASAAGCTVTPEGAVRIGLGYVLGARAGEIAQIVAAREEHGPYRSVEDLASRSGAGRPTLERLAWSGACDGLVDGDRRVALWQLGVTAPGYGMAEGTQLSLPLDLPGAPALESLTGWPAMVADYASTGLTTGTHPMGLLRDELEARGAAHSARLKEMRHADRVRIGGVVVARQRPGTAKGVVFMLLEDEHGTINLVVPPDIYERDRLIVRSEPLVIAEGVLERHPAGGGAINVLVRRIRPLDAPDRPLAQIAELAGHITLQDFSGVDAGELERLEQLAAGGVDAAGFRAVAPPVQSFANGRRR